MKKPNRKTVVKKLDKIFSQYIRARDNNTCIICGTKKRPTNGHLFSRTSYSTRWDELNCHCSCWGCNYKHEYDFYPYQTWFVNKYGQEAYDELHAKFRSLTKFSTPDLLDLIDTYKDKVKKLKESIDNGS